MLMPKFGMLTDPTVDILKEIKTIANLGFDFVEIGIEGPKGIPEILLKKKQKILELLNRYKLFALGHSSYWVDLGSEYKLVKKGWLEECKRIINTSAELKIILLNFHANSNGMYFKNDITKRIILDNLVKSLRELVSYGKQQNIRLMLENMPHEISNIKNFSYIMKQVPGLRVHLDIGHAFIQGGNEKY